MIFALQDNPLFQVKMYEDSEDLRASANTGLSAFVQKALTESTGLQTVKVNGTEYYMAGSPMETVGWAVVSVIEKSVTEQPAQALIRAYDEINDKASAEYSAATRKLDRQTLAVVILVLLLGILISQFVAGRIVKPIESMTDDIVEGARTGKQFEMTKLYSTGDEIEVLAKAFDDLSRKARKYVKDITAITAEKERISTELSLATQIQGAMLPHIFPPYPDRHEFDVFAMMEPAREVGGDFYDFFLIDDDHLCLTMADVSGKGIPAALFMMISKTILQSYYVTLTVEEICSAIIANAFGKQNRLNEQNYIQLTLVARENGDFELHLRDNAKSFNPIDMVTKRILDANNTEGLDAIGILMVKKKGKAVFLSPLSRLQCAGDHGLSTGSADCIV